MLRAEKAGEALLCRLSADRRASRRDIRLLAHLIIGCAAGLILLPLGLAPLTGFAVALPAGLGGTAAIFLLSAVALLALGRHHKVAVDGAGTDDLMFQAAAGLVLVLDGAGLVSRVGGRDRACFEGWMRPLAGRGFIEQVHVSDRILLMQALDRLRQGEAAFCVDLRLDRPISARQSGQFCHVRLDMTARHDQQGALQSVLLQMRDVAEEQALRVAAAEKALEAEAANEAKSRFLAAVSHELRTPLNAILGFSDILIGEYFGKFENDRQREYVTLVRQSGAHLLSLVNTMLDVSKIEAGRYELFLEAFGIGTVVEACQAMLALEAKQKGLTLASRLQRGLGEVIADQRAIRQILINLVGNAIKFTDAGGAITIDACASGDMLRLTVSDTGIGIPAAKLATLGQPFVQVQNEYTRRYEGTGLGLSLVKGLVALHGGTLTIESVEGEGTVITVLVPLDGTGAQTEEKLIANTVAFPPILKQVAEQMHARLSEGVTENEPYGNAKAKSA